MGVGSDAWSGGSSWYRASDLNEWWWTISSSIGSRRAESSLCPPVVLGGPACMSLIRWSLELILLNYRRNINPTPSHQTIPSVFGVQVEIVWWLVKGFNGKYNRISSSQNVYYPGDPLPQKKLDIIRNSSDTTLKRLLTYKQYEILRNMLANVVNIFKSNDIRYTLRNWHFH